MEPFTPLKAKQLLEEEYDFLSRGNLVIKKQFTTAGGKMSNTFLVEATNQAFIAKRPWGEPGSLELEWAVLKELQGKDVDVPRLIIPEHKPQHFLLEEFIDGIKASEAVLQGKNIDQIFYGVGVSTGKFHTIPANKFGGLLANDNVKWEDCLLDKLQERLRGCKTLITEQLYNQTANLIEILKPLMVSEGQGQPVLIHRDIYLENFIIREKINQAVLIDYGMVKGGRPFYDLGKFYILELYHHPEQRDNFLNAYKRFVPLPADFNEQMKLYILKEALGMIHFFHGLGQEKEMNHAITCLGELTDGHGVISELLKYYAN